MSQSFSTNWPRAVAFDLDGTLIDSASPICWALERLLSEEGKPGPNIDIVRTMIGDGTLSVVPRALAFARIEANEGELAGYRARFVAHLERAPITPQLVYPGIMLALQQLREVDIKLVLCTNKPSIVTRKTLNITGLGELLDAVACNDDVGFSKPDGRHLLEALAMLGEPAAGAVMVGDNGIDVQAARETCVPCVLAAYGYPRATAEELAPDEVANHPDEIVACVRRAWQLVSRPKE